MDLVPIAKNVLINPSHIGCVEQKIERGEKVLYLWIDGQKYEYEWEEKVPIEDFLEIINRNLNPTGQYWAG